MTDRNIIEIIEKTKDSSGRDRKNELIKVADKASISRIFLHLDVPHSDNRALLRALCEISSSAKNIETVTRNTIIYRKKILSLLSSNDPKTRKIVSELIGKTNPDAFLGELISALNNETTDFVKPSMILALGNIKENKDVVLPYLKELKITADEKKHRIEQELALKKAISSLGKEQKAAINPLPEGTVLVLDCPSVQVTLRDIKALGYEAKEARFPFNTVLVYGVERFRRIYAVRSFYTASVFYGEFKTLKDIEQALSSEHFSSFLHILFGKDTLPFRIELKCERGYEPENGRNKTAEALAAILDHKGINLLTSPSSYLFEIVVNITARGIMLSILPSRKLDDRFDYKKEHVAASIHPAAAAACISFAKNYMYSDATVLDCFCGSGTMLFERSRFAYKSLTGSDISPAAIKTARINERSAKTGAKFFAKNAIDSFWEQYDEVICNMPFGLRVGSHNENKELYAAFLNNLNKILTKRGRAFLFTNDKKLLSELLVKDFNIISKHSFSCGGLYPAMFIVERKK